MRILIIEDDQIKIIQLIQYLNDKFKECYINKKFSYQSGLKEIVDYDYDLILLDMSIPTYDITKSEHGGRKRPYGGKEIIRQMIRRNKKIPVIVVTQFEKFGELENSTTLNQLDNELTSLYSEVYLGIAYYSAILDSWKDEIDELIKKIGDI